MLHNEIVRQVQARMLSLPGGERWQDKDYDVADNLFLAVERLGIDVYKDQGKRRALQQMFTLSIPSGGIAELNDASGDVSTVTGELLVQCVPFESVLDSADNYYHWIPTLKEFWLPRPSALAYYTVARGNIYTCRPGISIQDAGDIVGAFSPVRITANFAPSYLANPSLLDNIPLELIDDLVSKAVEICLAAPMKTAA